MSELSTYMAIAHTNSIIKVIHLDLAPSFKTWRNCTALTHNAIPDLGANCVSLPNLVGWGGRLSSPAYWNDATGSLKCAFSFLFFFPWLFSLLHALYWRWKVLFYLILISSIKATSHTHKLTSQDTIAFIWSLGAYIYLSWTYKVKMTKQRMCYSI